MSSIKIRAWLFGLTALALMAVRVAVAQGVTFTGTLYQFTGKSDGSNPIGGVIEDSSGVIYGETYTGGTTSCTSKQIMYNRGCGTVYSLSPTTGLKVLATFTGPNGAHGNITLTLAGKTLYGATQQGGASDDGVVFSVNTDGGNYTLLHQFDGADGSAPAGNLVMGQGGVLYGIANTGGANNAGVLYMLASNGAYTVLHTFTLPISIYPNALLLAPNGTVVGSTTKGGNGSEPCPYGCGTIFTYTPSTGKFATVYTLPSSGADGYSPFAGSVSPTGTLYVADEQGEIFSLSQKNGFATIAVFDYYAAGAGVASGPLYTPSGALYGSLEGNQDGVGSIYTVQNGVIVAEAYIGAAGNGPEAQPYLTPTGSFIGTAAVQGLCDYCGGIWEYTPTTQSTTTTVRGRPQFD